MGNINVGKVVLGGLVAGLVLNVVDFLVNGLWLADDWEALMQSMNREPVGGSQIAVFVVMDFILGIAFVWLYAAIRPRFGAGQKTAVMAGLFGWFLAVLVPSVGGTIAGLYPVGLVTIMSVVFLIVAPIATVVGAAMYQEEDEGEAAGAASDAPPTY